MVILAAHQVSIDLHDAVVEAAARTYTLNGEQPVRGSALNGAWSALHHDTTPPDLYLPRLRRIEEIETEESLAMIDCPRLRGISEFGLEVWVLVPLNVAGLAQTILSGSADRLQPWWEHSGRIVFGSPRQI